MAKRQKKKSGWGVTNVDPKAEIIAAATIASRFSSVYGTPDPRPMDLLRGTARPAVLMEHWRALLKTMLRHNVALIPGHPDPAESIMIQATMHRYQSHLRDLLRAEGLL